MLAFIIDKDLARAGRYERLFRAAGTDCEISTRWADASSRLTQSPRPTLVLAAFDTLIAEGGLNSLMAASAQLKVLRLKTMLLFEPSELGDVETVRPLLELELLASTEFSDRELVTLLKDVVPKIAALEGEGEEEADEDDEIPPGTLIDGRYEIVDFVAAGGMGYIYRARQLPLGRIVALKLMRSELAREQDAIKRFQLEAKTVSVLNHPHTIVLYDYGVDGETMYLAMEWLDGQPLSEILEVEGALSPRRAAHIAQQVAESLAEAHAKGIVHRDLKPGNIFIVTSHAKPDYVKVLDFGIAKLVDTPAQDAGITRIGTICGTPEYMSPEQARGEDLDGRSDLYALGCCLYAMLDGAAPFVDDQPIKVIVKHQTEAFPPLAEGTPMELLELIDGCTAKDPDERFTSADKVAEDLASFLTQRTTTRGGDDFELLSNPFGEVDSPNDLIMTEAATPAAKTDSSPVQINIDSVTEGALQDFSLPRLLYLLSVTRQTGKLEIWQGRLRVSVPVVDGAVVKQGRSIDSLMAAFAWKEGNFSFSTEAPVVGARLHTLELLHQGIWRYVPMNQMMFDLQAGQNRYAIKTSLYESNQQVYAGFQGVQEVLEACDGERTIGQLMMAPLGGFDLVSKSLYLGLITDAVVSLDEPSEGSLSVTYRVDSVTHSEGAERDKGLLGELEDLYQKLSTNPRQALGVRRGSPEPAIMRGFDRLRDFLNSARFADGAPAIHNMRRKLMELGESKVRELLKEGTPRPSSPEEQALVRSLRMKLEKSRRQDPYELFGVSRGCGPQVVESTFLLLVKEHHPDQYAALNNEVIKDFSHKLYLAIDEAKKKLLQLEQKRSKKSGPSTGSSWLLSTSVGDGGEGVVNDGATESLLTGNAASGPSRGSHPGSSPQISQPVSIRGASRPRSQLGVSAVSRPTPTPKTSRRSSVSGVRAVPRPAAKPSSSQPATPRGGARKPAPVRAIPRPGAQRSGESRSVKPVASNSGEGPRLKESQKPAIQRPSSRGVKRARAVQRPPSSRGEKVRLGQRKQAPKKVRMSDILASRGQGGEKEVEHEFSAIERPSTTVNTFGKPADIYKDGLKALKANKPDRALKFFQAASNQDPEAAEYAVFLAWARFLCDPSKIDSAQRSMKDLRQRFPDDAESSYFLGKLAMRQGDFDAARKAYETALRRNQRHLEAERELRIAQMRLQESKQDKSFFGRFVRKVKEKLEE